MKKLSLITTVSVAALALIGLTFAGSDHSDESKADTDVVEKTFDVKSGGTLIVDSDAGSLNIKSHKENTVSVQVFKRGRNAEDFEVRMVQDGDDVRVRGDKESGWGNYRLSVRYVIKVPKTYNLNLDTGGGSIEVENLRGEVEAFTSGGSIQLGDIEGDVQVKTSGGSIRVGDVAGNIRAHTSGGSIKAKLSKQLTEDGKLTTSGGSISVSLNPSMNLDLNASTSGGRVRSDLAVKGTVKKSGIKGTINGGGPKLTLRTSGGNISIKEL